MQKDDHPAMVFSQDDIRALREPAVLPIEDAMDPTARVAADFHREMLAAIRTAEENGYIGEACGDLVLTRDAGKLVLTLKKS